MTKALNIVNQYSFWLCETVNVQVSLKFRAGSELLLFTHAGRESGLKVRLYAILMGGVDQIRKSKWFLWHARYQSGRGVSWCCYSKQRE